MKKASLAMIGILFVGAIMAFGAGAYEIGENHVENGDFEAGETGVIPAGWWLRIVG